MQRPQKKYLVWVESDIQGSYVPEEFDTPEEALLSQKYGRNWYLTEAVNNINAYTRFDKPEKA